MAKAKSLKITQKKSVIGGNQAQRASVRSLGLKRVGDSVVREDTPQNRGFIAKVTHLVEVEEVDA